MGLDSVQKAYAGPEIFGLTHTATLRFVLMKIFTLDTNGTGWGSLYGTLNS
jgi:hypothetical protein